MGAPTVTVAPSAVPNVPCAQSTYENPKTGQTSLLRPEADPFFVETELFLNFSPEEMESLAKVLKLTYIYVYMIYLHISRWLHRHVSTPRMSVYFI